MSVTDADLQRVIAVWNKLPDAMRAAIIALVAAVSMRPMIEKASQSNAISDIDVAVWRVARECRNIIQGCLREEEWQDVDQEFFRVIRDAQKLFTHSQRG